MMKRSRRSARRRGSSRAPGAAVPQLAGDVLDRLAGRLDVGVRRHLETAGVRQHPVAGDLLELRDDGEVVADGPDAVALPERVEVAERPGTGGPQGDAAVTGTAYLAADHQQPGAEHGGGIGTLGILEERRVDRAGAVVEGQEHHAPP